MTDSLVCANDGREAAWREPHALPCFPWPDRAAFSVILGAAYHPIRVLLLDPHVVIGEFRGDPRLLRWTLHHESMHHAGNFTRQRQRIRLAAADAYFIVLELAARPSQELWTELSEVSGRISNSLENIAFVEELLATVFATRIESELDRSFLSSGIEALAVEGQSRRFGKTFADMYGVLRQQLHLGQPLPAFSVLDFVTEPRDAKEILARLHLVVEAIGNSPPAADKDLDWVEWLMQTVDGTREWWARLPAVAEDLSVAMALRRIQWDKRFGMSGPLEELCMSENPSIEWTVVTAEGLALLAARSDSPVGRIALNESLRGMHLAVGRLPDAAKRAGWLIAHRAYSATGGKPAPLLVHLSPDGQPFDRQSRSAVEWLVFFEGVRGMLGGTEGLECPLAGNSTNCCGRAMLLERLWQAGKSARSEGWHRFDSWSKPACLRG